VQEGQHRLLAILVTLGMALSAGRPLGRSAQAGPPDSRGLPGEQTPVDDLERSFRIDSYQLVAKEGAARGETIYRYKCWVCHNQYQKSAPQLTDLYKRPNLLSDEPVNDQTVSAQIKNGNPGMPSFRTTLSDSDIADLVSYLRGGKCCREEQNPQANPWYRASAEVFVYRLTLIDGQGYDIRVLTQFLLYAAA
jgi:mono/diheme cytochrome c family protein